MGSPPRSSPASPASLRSQLNRYRHCASLDPQRRFRWRKEDSCMRKDDSGCATTIPEAQGRFRMRNDVSGRARKIPACATTIPVAQGRFRHAQRRFWSRKEDSGMRNDDSGRARKISGMRNDDSGRAEKIPACATTIPVAQGRFRMRNDDSGGASHAASPASSASLARRLFCEDAKWVEFRGHRSAKS